MQSDVDNVGPATTFHDGTDGHVYDPAAVAMARAASAGEIDAAAALHRLLGDPTRFRLLAALRAAGELCVCDLAEATGSAESTVSQALRLLRAAQIVTTRRCGRRIHYRLADAHVTALLDLTRDHLEHSSGLADQREVTP